MTFPTRESSHFRTVHGRHDVTVLHSGHAMQQGTSTSMNQEQTQKNGVLPWARKTTGNTSRQIARGVPCHSRLVPQDLATRETGTKGRCPDAANYILRRSATQGQH